MFLILGRKHLTFIINMMFAVDFLEVHFIKLRKFVSSPNLLSLSWISVVFCQRLFSPPFFCISWCGFSSLVCICMDCISWLFRYWTNFVYLEYHSSSWYIILFLYCWIQFANILLKIFVAKFVRGSIVFLLSLSGFDIREI